MSALGLVLDRTIERRALATGRIIDAISGTPPREPVSIRVDAIGIRVRMGAGGLFALSGRTLAQPATIVLTARRYAPRSVVVPSATALPVDLGTIELQPLPVRLEGRITREVNRTPFEQAVIGIARSEKLLLLRTPLHRVHPEGTTVAMQTLTTSGNARTLTSAAPAGTRTFALDDATGFAPGDVLHFSGREYGVVETATTSDVTLTYALRRSYPAGAEVAPVVIGQVSATASTRRNVAPGDALLPIDTEVEGRGVAVGTPPEYHALGVAADPDGYFAVDGIAGEPALALTACGLSAGTFPIDYGKDVNRVSLRIKKKGNEPCLNT